MTDVLFGQGYFLRFDPKLWKAMQPYPPLGTLYAASYIRQGGFDVALFDAMLASSVDEWGAMIAHTKPQYAVIYEDNFNYLSKMCLLNMRQATFEMIDLARSHGCTVIVAGSDASDHSAAYLEEGCDFVLIGEGEETLLELLNVLKTGDGAFTEILGLAYQVDGEVVVNQRRPDIKDLDALPFPAWDLVDIDKYKAIWRERHGFFSMNMVTTRGCPFHCNWCAKPIWGQRYHSRSPENVAAELSWLSEMYEPDHIWFADDIFGLQPGWVSNYAGQLRKLGLSIPFKSLSRADLLLREGEVEALKAAGADIVWMGAESGAQSVLDNMEKGTKVEQIYHSSSKLRQAGIKVGFFLQFGYPGETREDIEATIQMVRECMPDDIGISVSYPLPGTKFHTAVKDQLNEKTNWLDSEDLDMLFHGPFAADFYRHLHGVVHKEYRARKTWEKVKRLDPQPPKRIASMLYSWLTLPAARKKLDKLAELPHKGISPVGPQLQPKDAAQPSPQDW